MEGFNETEAGTPMDEIRAPIQIEGVKFAKQALISSPKFPAIGQNILKLTLDDDKEYTIARVQKVIDKLKEGS